ncbi:hypothetical protein GCM10022226_09900 [Sphaerisporangium flaviroseum]|uniref:Uncharacterized protein n=1 Tax=Sphaerisporangium flaviroseum TaxID=509199 RepID=A0ABP7HEZ8_9ACTN
MESRYFPNATPVVLTLRHGGGASGTLGRQLLPEAKCYHQQYLHEVPNGYCGIGGTGVACPVGLTTGEA